jgi:hypothetical protein
MAGGSDRAWRPVADRLMLAIARALSRPGLQRKQTRGLEARRRSRHH